jgi:hypothetical protein
VPHYQHWASGIQRDEAQVLKQNRLWNEEHRYPVMLVRDVVVDVDTAVVGRDGAMTAPPLRSSLHTALGVVAGSTVAPSVAVMRLRRFCRHCRVSHFHHDVS